ncbi:type VI secretion system membrane subunit TssM [Xylophilus sp. Kf1]|nr:type VI secretion system membrane subunit TssM [Xylophilus sp. Kf1]
MPFFQSLLRLVLSRAMLFVCGLLLAGLVLWFGGPLVAFDGVSPLASVTARLAVLALLAATGLLLLSGGPLGPLLVVCLCMAVWYAGPWLSLGRAQPLVSREARILCIVALLVVYAGTCVYRLLRRMSEDPELLGRWLRPRKADDDAGARRRAVAPIEPKLQRALTRLRAMGEGGLWRRWFQSRRHLYALPWYLVIGPAGAGKTALLRQSGLQFPLAHDSGHPVQAALPTTDCDWWLSNQAVMLDTAGRYCHAAPADPSVPPGRPAPADDARLQWHGLLQLLRKHRPRAPVNGVLLVVSVADLLETDAPARSRQAGVLRQRLAELRETLGICFPVYLVVTKTDQLRGFREFFQALTSEGRTQVWGFTLDTPRPARPWHRAVSPDGGRHTLRDQVAAQLDLLHQRLRAGLRIRLNEEFELDRRQRLFTLPLEVAALSESVARLVDEVFLDSRFDETADPRTLRGVYFCSAGQGGGSVCLPAGTLVQQLTQAGGQPPPVPDLSVTEHQSFFLHDLLGRVVVAEAHRVRPNRRWELRFRLLRLLGHSLALCLFGWLAVSFTTSWRNNLAYLDTVQARTVALRAQVLQLLAEPTRARVPAVLDAARQVATHPALGDGAVAAGGKSPGAFGYGLSVADPVMAASDRVYAGLQEHLLLPTVLQRMRVVLAARLRENDAPGVYATLRVYKLLHDPARYRAEDSAREVRDWVLDDLATPQGAAALGVGDATAAHVRSLFSGARPMQSAAPADLALIRQAQAFLDSRTAAQRLYDRARAAFQKDAPPDFTLVRAVGPQAGTVFSRGGGLSLESGVPGLYTYDGYHGLFEKRLASFIGRAFAQDAWVMDRSESEQAAAGRAAQDRPQPGADASVDPMVDAVRRQYLADYVDHWDRFLGSIRAVGTARSSTSTEAAGGSLGFDLSVLRQLAAPDSPLIRLARAAARETTLAPGPAGRPSAALPAAASIFALAAPASLTAPDAVQPGEASSGPASPGAVQRAEPLARTLVDQHFAALHELAASPAEPGAADGSGLAAVSVAINDFYTQLVVADTALAAGSLPPAGAETGARLLLEAGKLPPPLREVLVALARNGGARVADSAGTILRRQAQQQLDRLLGLLAQNVGEPCRRGIEGRYPFAASSQDAAVEDVVQMFGVGGAADEFFQRHLALFVDTSVRPWRYRTSPVGIASFSPNAAGAANANHSGPGATDPPAPTGTGPTLAGEWLKLLAQSGPDLDTFYRAQKIRELFFRENGGRKLGWKLDITVFDLDPTITDLVIDIDGQALRYRHGPPQALKVEWPGPRGGSVASLTAQPLISGATSVVSADGPWALLHLLDKGRVLSSATAGRISFELGFDGRKALLGIGTGSQPNPLNSDVLRGFHCPATAA